jgi:DnaK suppressor protein
MMTNGTATYEQLLLNKRTAVLSDLGIKPDVERPSAAAEEDRAQISHDEFVSLRLNSLEYVQLRLVNEALDRIRSGDYGICAECEKEIPGKRLNALPWARYCVPCQEEMSTVEQEVRRFSPVRLG